MTALIAVIFASILGLPAHTATLIVNKSQLKNVDAYVESYTIETRLAVDRWTQKAAEFRFTPNATDEQFAREAQASLDLT